jgi:hypothetical protein
MFISSSTRTLTLRSRTRSRLPRTKMNPSHNTKWTSTTRTKTRRKAAQRSASPLKVSNLHLPYCTHLNPDNFSFTAVVCLESKLPEEPFTRPKPGRRKLPIGWATLGQEAGPSTRASSRHGVTKTLTSASQLVSRRDCSHLTNRILTNSSLY